MTEISDEMVEAGAKTIPATGINWETLHGEYKESCRQTARRILQAALSQAPQGWRTIDSAPREYKQVMVWQPVPFDTFHGDTRMATSPAGPYNAHWDEIDRAWCLSGGTWAGPFLEPTHWMPLPPAPTHKG